MGMEVTQADRDIAWPHRPACYYAADKGNWDSGVYDACSVIQDFARHRQSSIASLTGDVGNALTDPNAVHVNMLRGGIARPSLAQIIHIYGEDALRAALTPSPLTDAPDAVRVALEWYGEQARLARLIHSEGDAGRRALAADGGKKARAVLSVETDRSCRARAGQSDANDPQDCNWPICGCDPRADRVIAALDEMGLLAATTPPAKDDAGRLREKP